MEWGDHRAGGQRVSVRCELPSQVRGGVQQIGGGRRREGEGEVVKVEAEGEGEGCAAPVMS